MDADELKQAIPIADLLEALQLQPNRAGFLSCPGHPDKTPSLKIYEKTDSFYCFSCNTGGTIIDFYMLYFDCSFTEAVEGLAILFNLSSSHTTTATARRLYKTRRRKAKITEHDYWQNKWLEYRKILSQDNSTITDELAEACQKIAYAEYRMDRSRGK